jgi:hypothetical protein
MRLYRFCQISFVPVAVLLPVLFVTIFFLASCGKDSQKGKFFSLKKLSLFIGMPKNKSEFENVSPLVYDSLCDSFQAFGFCLVSSKDKASYGLLISVDKIDFGYRFISPSLLTYHANFVITLTVKLLHYKGNLCTEKTFCFSKIISRPNRKILERSFFRFEFEKLLDENSFKIVTYCSSFFKSDLENEKVIPK